MKLDRQVAFAVLLGTALYFFLPASSDWFARLCEKWVSVELLLRMLNKHGTRTE